MNSKPDKRKVKRKFTRKFTRKRRARAQRGGLNITDVSDVGQQHAFLDLAKAYNWEEVESALESLSPEQQEFLLNVQPSGRWSVLHQAEESGNAKIFQKLLALAELDPAPEPAPEPEMSFPPGLHPFTPEVLAGAAPWAGGGPLELSVIDTLIEEGNLVVVEEVYTDVATHHMAEQPEFTGLNIFMPKEDQINAIKSLFVEVKWDKGTFVATGLSAGRGMPPLQVERKVEGHPSQILRRVDSDQPIPIPGVIAIWNGGGGWDATDRKDIYVLCKNKVQEDFENTRKILDNLTELQSNPLYRLDKREEAHIRNYTDFRENKAYDDLRRT